MNCWLLVYTSRPSSREYPKSRRIPRPRPTPVRGMPAGTFPIRP